MAAKSAKIGSISFVVGVVIAIVLGLISLDASLTAILTSVLVVLGLIVGFMNITEKETKDFLFVTAVLVVVSYCSGATWQSLSNVPVVGDMISNILRNIMTFIMPATIVVGMKAMLSLAKD